MGRRVCLGRLCVADSGQAVGDRVGPISRRWSFSGTQCWVGIRLDILPPGAKVLLQIEVYGVKPDPQLSTLPTGLKGTQFPDRYRDGVTSFPEKAAKISRLKREAEPSPLSRARRRPRAV